MSRSEEKADGEDIFVPEKPALRDDAQCIDTEVDEVLLSSYSPKVDSALLTKTNSWVVITVDRNAQTATTAELHSDDIVIIEGPSDDDGDSTIEQLELGPLVKSSTGPAIAQVPVTGPERTKPIGYHSDLSLRYVIQWICSYCNNIL